MKPGTKMSARRSLFGSRSLSPASLHGALAVLAAHLLMPWIIVTQAFDAQFRPRWEITSGAQSQTRLRQAGSGGIDDTAQYIRVSDAFSEHCGGITSSPAAKPAQRLLLPTKRSMSRSFRESTSAALLMHKKFQDDAEDESYNTTTSVQILSSTSEASDSIQQSSCYCYVPSGGSSSGRSRRRQFDPVSWSLSPSKNALTRVNGAHYEPAPNVRRSLGPLWKMTRPENFPGIVLFHLLGVHLAAQHVASIPGVSSTIGTVRYWRLVRHPGLITTLLALLLTSSASMVVNDYYDCKLGRDEEKLHKSPSGQLLLRGDVPLRVARRFLNYLYAMSLLVLVVVPGIPTRLSVAVGLMLTYYYTQKLKPVCWVKNIVCACLIALSPLTSGTAAVHLITTGRQAFAQSLSIPSLWRLVSVLFFGVLGREVAMDCNDCASDERSGIRTVPVVHGRRYAASVALVSNAVVAFFAVGGPLLQILRGRVPLSCTVRRLALASIGSAMMLRRSYQVLRSECSDEAIVNRAVNEGLLTVIFFLASFI